MSNIIGIVAYDADAASRLARAGDYLDRHEIDLGKLAEDFGVGTSIGYEVIEHQLIRTLTVAKGAQPAPAEKVLERTLAAARFVASINRLYREGRVQLVTAIH